MKIFLIIAVSVLGLYSIILTYSHLNLAEQLNAIENEVTRLTKLVDNLSNRVNLLSHPSINVRRTVEPTVSLEEIMEEIRNE